MPVTLSVLHFRAFQEHFECVHVYFTTPSDSLIRTSRLLRDSKSTSSRVSFIDPGTPFETEVVEEDDEVVRDREEEVGETSSTESLDLGSDDLAPQGEAPLPRQSSQPSLSQQSPTHQQQPNLTSIVKQSPPSKPSSEGSSTALDQLTGHIAFMRLLEPGECLSSIYRCARICGLDVHEGLLLFGREHFYVIDGFTLMNTHEIVSIEALPPGMQHKPIVPTGTDIVPPNRRYISSSSPSYASDLVSSGAVEQISGNQ